MVENEADNKSLAEQWFEEQQAWQKTMRGYADAMVTDEQFLQHLGNAMKGSLLAGAAYPQSPAPAAPAGAGDEKLAEILFVLKRIDGRLRDVEAAVESLRATNIAPVGDAGRPLADHVRTHDDPAAPGAGTGAG